MPLGSAVKTSAGRLRFKAIIHVAGINMFWRSSKQSVQDSVRNALALAREHGYQSIAFPLIGAGSGGLSAHQVLEIMVETLKDCELDGSVRIVRFKKKG